MTFQLKIFSTCEQVQNQFIEVLIHWFYIFLNLFYSN
ncbi:Uncharacterised protein [Leminorella richardii]|uniref:Uncharacterized protein n=1 Tax=Leminorella richardii TaxID=158841 RepID=A0A2X4XNW1_9GAMM|nr:Uncharacterised protein [Leminorella richardii]